jgi:hypothetical protein
MAEHPSRMALSAALLIAVAVSCTEEVPVDTPETSGAPASRAVVPVVAADPGLPVKTRDGWLRGTPVAAEGRFARDYYTRLVGEQLAFYPPPLLERVGLKQVVLCDALSFEGTDCFAYADVERGRLYLSVRAGINPGYIKRTVHHETFHQFDYADDRRLDADPRWEALNPPGFRYPNDAERAQADPDALRPDEGLPGFLNRYAASSPAEDKAELFASLVVERDLVRRREARDEVIRRKVERLREMLDGFGPSGRALVDP